MIYRVKIVKGTPSGVLREYWLVVDGAVVKKSTVYPSVELVSEAHKRASDLGCKHYLDQNGDAVLAKGATGVKKSS